MAGLAVPLFLGVTGLGLYLSVTQPDRAIARLKSEIRKEGLDISDRGRMRQTYPDLERLGKDITAFERPAFASMTPAEQTQYIKNTEAIFQQVRSQAYGAPRPERYLVDMYSSRVARLCRQRALYYAKTDPEEALEALRALNALAEHWASVGSTQSLTQYSTAYAGLVAKWINQPSWLARLDELKSPEVDPMEVLRNHVDEVTLAFQELKMEYSFSPKELWSNFQSFTDWKRQEREYYEQVFATLREADSKSALALAVSVSKVSSSFPSVFDGIEMELGFMARVELSRQQSEAFIEMQRTVPKATILPKREPFIDPFSGESFLLHREGDTLWVMSVGPNGRPDMGNEDDIVAKFKLPLTTPP